MYLYYSLARPSRWVLYICCPSQPQISAAFASSTRHTKRLRSLTATNKRQPPVGNLTIPLLVIGLLTNHGMMLLMMMTTAMTASTHTAARTPVPYLGT
jgi:hypothetical protein